MTKIKKTELRDLTKEIYEELTTQSVTNKTLEPFIEAVFLAVEEALLDGNDVPLGNVGTLKQKVRAARKGRNPQSGAEIQIPESKAVGFTQSKHMKTELNK